MAGYNYSKGMSNNAVLAYSHGIKPITAFCKADFTDVGIELPINFCKWLAKNNYWPCAEWHHSGGGFYNKVDFFDVQTLRDLIDSGDIDVAELLAKYKTATADKAKPVKVAGQYRHWQGKKYIGEIPFIGNLIGNWIHLPDGTRKKADGNNIEWRKL